MGFVVRTLWIGLDLVSGRDSDRLEELFQLFVRVSAREFVHEE